MAILSFLGRVNIAVRIVTEKYPDAKLYEVQGKSSKGPTSDWKDVDELTVIFGRPSEQGGSTIEIKSTGWGEFGEPREVPSPWLGDVILVWPIKMELEEAIALKEKAGYTKPFICVTLRQPLHYQVADPYYIFGEHTKPPTPFIFVNLTTKEVTEGE